MAVIAVDTIVEVTIVVALLPHAVDTVVVLTANVNVLLVIPLPIGNIRLCLDEMIRILRVMLPEGRNMFLREGRVRDMKTAPQGGRLLMVLSREGLVKEMIIGVIDDPFHSLGRN